MTKLSLAPGMVIGERYRLVSLLGTGATGEVWRAEHATLRAPVALKVLGLELLAPDRHTRRGADRDAANAAFREDVLARFLREAQTAAALRSPHVVQILDHGVDGDTPYIAMELLEGETLAARIERVKALGPEQTAILITHIARALGKAHDAGVVHRDLKPDNIFLVHNDDEEVAKVLDFGIAKMTRSPLDPGQVLATRSGWLVGTPCYMSPEQAQGKRDLDWRSDLWAMAVIAFECVCGRRPFESEAVGTLVLQICALPLPVPSQIAKVPPGFDAWWARAASRDPAERFQSAKELAETLRAVLAPDLPFGMSGAYPAARPDAALLGERDSRGPKAPAAMTHRGVVSAVEERAGGRRKPRRGALLAAIAAGGLIGGAAIVAVWRMAPPRDEPAQAGPEATGVAPATSDAPDPGVLPAQAASAEPAAAGATAPAAADAGADASPAADGAGDPGDEVAPALPDGAGAPDGEGAGAPDGEGAGAPDGEGAGAPDAERAGAPDAAAAPAPPRPLPAPRPRSTGPDRLGI